MSHYKLYYFNIRGRGEFIRYMFAHTNTPYDELTIMFPLHPETDWPEWKGKMPTNQVPMLAVDGKCEIGTTMAIGYYLGNKLGLNAKSDEDNALGLMYVDVVQDSIFKFVPCFIAKAKGNEDEFKSAWERIGPEVAKPLFDKVEGFLQKTGTGYIVGDSLTWYDFLIATWLPQLARAFDETLLDEHPLIKAHTAKIESLPTLQDQIKKAEGYPLPF